MNLNCSISLVPVTKMTITLIKLYLVLSVLSLGILTAVPPRSRQEDGYTVIGTIYDTHAKIESDGYVAESHEVVTPDGYVLRMHRIPYGRDQPTNEPRTPVFLMHGLSGASVGYVIQGPDFSMGYNLADAGFDVWMGNARGNRNSRSHISLSPDDEVEKFQFFDFTWEEIGTLDLPTMIDYVLQQTGFEKLHYIGHSQGGTNFMVLNSMRPEYNEKFISAHLLAGVGFMEHFPDEQLAQLAQNINLIYGLALSLGVVEFFPPGFNVSEILPLYLPFPRSALDCTMDSKEVMQLCDFLDRNDDDEDDMWETIVGGGAGAAAKQFAHYGQNILSKQFCRFDHGTEDNMEIYGTEDPPIYDISLVTVDTVMHYTVADHLLDERDVLAMAEVMPNTVARRIAKDTYGHSDFILTEDTKELVTDFIIERMLSFEDGLSEEETEEEEEEDQEAYTTPAPGAASSISLEMVLKTYFVVFLYFRINKVILM